MTYTNGLQFHHHGLGLLCHVVGTVEDDGLMLVVFWCWSKYKQRRIYMVEPDYVITAAQPPDERHARL